MADTPYRNVNFIFASKGINARNVDDTLADGFWLNEDNAEELAENSISQRLGTTIINRTGVTINALPGEVHSIQKLAGLGGSDWRYAGVGETLWRRTGLTQGPYQELIHSGMSASPWTSAIYRPDLSSIPYIFIADAAMMLKDNGYLATPQRNGIFQPQYPVIAQVQMPDLIILDNYFGSAMDYTYDGIAGGTIADYVSTVLHSEVLAAPQLANAVAADPSLIQLFQLLTIGDGPDIETVLTLALEIVEGVTIFQALFQNNHVLDENITAASLSVDVPASTTATVSKAFGVKPIAAWPALLSTSDYISLLLYVSDPESIQSITLKFDCGDGSFNTDYFYKVIAQGPLQSLLNTTTDPTTAATDAVLSDALALYGNSPGGVSALQSGLDTWTPLLLQLSDFAGAGRASFTDSFYNWNNVNGYQLQIVTNDGGSVTVQIASLVLVGGAGPDTLGGVAYDYLFTFYNSVDGTESNPSMTMSNVNPPNTTEWVYPRREPVMLTLRYPLLDPQTDTLRIYRRGGTLGDEYRRVDQVSLTGSPQSYTDMASDSDIEASDFVSFVNDVPVTSSLPNPVNTTLAHNAGPEELALSSVYPVSMDNISVGQQIDIGNPASPLNNFETVIVTTLYSDHFLALVQNGHYAGEPVQATAVYGQPVTIIAQAYNQMWYAGDPNNPHYLYYSSAANPQAVGSANYVEVGTPDDPITAIVQFKGNLYVSTRKFWWAIAPGSNQTGTPTVYPTAAKHGCVAPLGWCATEEAIYYQAIDGIRRFAGGASEYLTQGIEFIFQGIGSSPVVEADQTQLSQTRMAYWNNMIFVSYIGVDSERHRVILHTVYQRWRNDDLDVQSLLLEADTNTLVFGDSQGLVRMDRQNQAYDETNNAGALVKTGIVINLQSPYSDQGMPAVQKQYNEFTIDCNTNGQTLEITLLFNDGEEELTLGEVNTTQRQRININLENGDGYQAYKVSVKITGVVTQTIYIYQAGIKYLPLAKTRQSIDTYQLRLGTDESKFAKQVFFEYTATADITFEVYYDAAETPGFTFTLPNTNGVRNAQRVRLPAISFRMIRFVGTCAQDFYIWESSRIEWKQQGVGKGYQVVEFVPNA
jgi:hypothetical protein